jgi:hypothetical protein
MDGVGVNEREEEEDDPEDFLNGRKSDNDFGLGHDDGGFDDCWSVGSEGVSVIGEGGTELSHSLAAGVIKDEAGVAVPGVDEDEEGSVWSLFLFEEQQLLRLELSWYSWSGSKATAWAIGVAGQEIWVASSTSGITISSPSSEMKTERRGSGRGAKRILRGGGDRAEDG